MKGLDQGVSLCYRGWGNVMVWAIFGQDFAGFLQDLQDCGTALIRAGFAHRASHGGDDCVRDSSFIEIVELAG